MIEKTKPVSIRDTQLSSGADIARRLAFLACTLGGVVGAIATVAGLTGKKPALWIPGLMAMAIAALLLVFRNKLGLTRIKAELEQNPFKPTRVPKD